jgi:putative SOS response-associated peptidase YedK
MCGRYTLKSPVINIEETFQAKFRPTYKPNWNIAPTTNCAVITSKEPGIIDEYHFGLVPHWAKDKKVGFSLLNARTETIMEKPSFKPLMENNRRCLILADSFYEWETVGKDKLPYRFVLPNQELFAFAGLYSWWKDPLSEEWYKSFTILTTRPNDMVSKLHDRMPVILTREEEKIWLTDGVPMSDLLQLCDPFPEVEMDLYRVSKEVNNVRNNHEGLILPENSK